MEKTVSEEREQTSADAKKPWIKPEITAFASISETRAGILTSKNIEIPPVYQQS